MPRIRLLSTILAAALAAGALALTACGGDSVPGNAVASVDGTSITKEDFARWMTVASLSQQQQANPTGTAKANVPVPPDFKACIAQAKATLPKKLPKGQTNPTEAQLKAQCQQQYNALRDQVLQFLISAEWIIGEAKAQGIELTDQQVKAEFAKQKKQSFPKEADFQKYLKTSGMTMDDLLLRVKVDTLSTKLRDKITKGAAKPTQAQISAYYAKNKAQFGKPETRDIKIVLTKTEAQAQAAKKALEAGDDFKVVAKKYSIDQATKNTGGVLTGVTKGQQEAALDKAVFAASKSKVYGPIKTQFGYYVFEVTKITKGSQQTLQQATPQITQVLTQQNQQKALDTFVKTFQDDWKGKTNCRSGYVVQQCKNAPKPKTTTSAAGSAPQQGTPVPQGAPPAQGQSAPTNP